MNETKSSKIVSTKLQRIAELARRFPTSPLTTLSHHIDMDFLREAHRHTRKDGATGIDNQTAAEYAKDLEVNLQSLLRRFHEGTYHAPPVRRHYIPKGAGESRPIGIPTFEDKILQRAVMMVLSAVYEQKFLDCSYAFRPGRSQHQAVKALRRKLMMWQGRYVVELDIRSFFDTLDRRVLRSFLDQRVRDGVVRRAIDKWLKAGVLEKGRLFYPSSGSPQGGVISPILSNIYLHEVLDVWFEQMVKPVLKQKAFLFRFADDAVLVFSSQEDARRVLATLPKRFSKYGLTLHPGKTRLVPFVRPLQGVRRRDRKQAESFDFLGFTLCWGLSRGGSWIVKVRTAKDRLHRALKRVGDWCRRHRHKSVRDQHAKLVKKLKGHYAYYGLIGNSPCLASFYQGVRRLWRYWLNRRCQRPRMPWTRYLRLLEQYALPGPVVVHARYRRRVANL